MINKITSSKNERIKHIKSLLQKKWRTEFGEFICEGGVTVLEAYSSGAAIKTIIASENYDLPYELSHFNNIIVVPSRIFEGLADTKTPQGILAVIDMPDSNTEPHEDGLLVYCDGVRDPGNLGTIIRTADAAGFKGVMLSSDCVDAYSPKVVRATMGSFFHIDIYNNINHDELKRLLSKREMFGGVINDNTINYCEAEYDSRSIIAVGNEATGMREDIISLCTPVKIPIFGKAESLNVGVAAGLLMYKARERVR